MLRVGLWTACFMALSDCAVDSMLWSQVMGAALPRAHGLSIACVSGPFRAKTNAGGMVRHLFSYNKDLQPFLA